MTFDSTGEERNSRYLLPCVWKAIQMVEILRRTPGGLRVDELQGMTGYSRGTIYRILRTLIVCEYAFRDTGGFYRLNRDVVLPLQAKISLPVGARLTVSPSAVANENDAGFERWGVRFHADGRRLPTRPRRGNPGSAKQLRKRK